MCIPCGSEGRGSRSRRTVRAMERETRVSRRIATMRIKVVCSLLLATLSLVVLSACQPGRGNDTQPASSAAAPTLDDLRNATYVGLEVAGDTVTLRNGHWLGK